MEDARASRFEYVPEFVHDGRVEKEAFMPPEKPRPYETSVIMHDTNGIVWHAGFQIGLGRKNPKPLVGSAEFSEMDATLAELEMVPAPSSISPLHANLVGWDETDKLRRIAQADEISRRSVFFKTPGQLTVGR